MKIIPLLAVFILTIYSNAQPIDLNSLSEDFIREARNGGDTQFYEEQLANLTLDEFEKALTSDTKRIAFWVNLYNAYIQVVLKENPEAYKNRSSFFSKHQLRIAGVEVSFSTLEHGILRKSKWDKGLGYVRKWFVSDFERRLRVNNVDYRIHFALNCGAQDCPPVAVYTPERLEEQLAKGTRLFLEKTTEYNPNKKEVQVTALFSWFRGDFGGGNGTKNILREHMLIPTTKNISLKYKSYDWTLQLDNFIDL